MCLLKSSNNTLLSSTTLDDGDNKYEYAKVVVGKDEIIVCSCRFSYRWTKTLPKQNFSIKMCLTNIPMMLNVGYTGGEE